MVEYKRQVAPTETYTLRDFLELAKYNLSKLEKILEEVLEEGGSHKQISKEFKELYSGKDFKEAVEDSLNRISHLGYLIQEKFPEEDMEGLSKDDVLSARVETRDLFEKYESCLNILKEYIPEVIK